MSGGRGSGPSDATVLVLIGVALALGVAIWLWGGVAGLLFGTGWPRIGAGQTFGVLVRLPDRLADPARAWPRPARGRLPGAPGVYATLALLGATAGRQAFAARDGLALMACRPDVALGVAQPRPNSVWPDDVIDLTEALLLRRVPC